MTQPTNIREYAAQLSPDISGQEIHEARTKLGLSPDELAQVLDVSTVALLSWESGEDAAEAPGAVKYSIAYLRLCHQMLTDEVFGSLDQRIDEMEALREKLKRDRAQTRAMLDKYEAELPPAPPVT